MVRTATSTKVRTATAFSDILAALLGCIRWLIIPLFFLSPAKILDLGFVLQGLWVGVWRRLFHAQRDLMLACLDAPAKFMSRIGAEKTLTCA